MSNIQSFTIKARLNRHVEDGDDRRARISDLQLEQYVGISHLEEPKAVLSEAIQALVLRFLRDLTSQDLQNSSTRFHICSFEIGVAQVDPDDSAVPCSNFTVGHSRLPSDNEKPLDVYHALADHCWLSLMPIVQELRG